MVLAAFAAPVVFKSSSDASSAVMIPSSPCTMLPEMLRVSGTFPSVGWEKSPEIIFFVGGGRVCAAPSCSPEELMDVLARWRCAGRAALRRESGALMGLG
jgi:hypothetical protein